jgi:hypothetical protein
MRVNFNPVVPDGTPVAGRANLGPGQFDETGHDLAGGGLGIPAEGRIDEAD